MTRHARNENIKKEIIDISCFSFTSIQRFSSKPIISWQQAMRLIAVMAKFFHQILV